MTTALPQPQARRIPKWTLADRLRKIRTDAGWQQREIAEELSVTPSAYAQWEANRAIPRNLVSLAQRIELLTGVPAAWTLGVDEESPRPVDPDEGLLVRHQGLEPRTRWFGVDADEGTVVPFPGHLETEHRERRIAA